MRLNSIKNNGVVSVMYHYVRDNKKEGTPNLKSLDIDDFKGQLDWLEDNFEPMSFEEFDVCIKNNIKFPDNKFLLTFDDGLKDHYKYVYPEIKNRNLWGQFYINSQIYLQKKPLAVHVTHMILDKIGANKYTQIIQDELLKLNIQVKDFHIDGVYRYDDIDYSTIKIIMNYLLDYDIRDGIVDNLFRKYFDNEYRFCKNFYCSEQELKEMKEGGMIIGCHSHSHKILSRLSYQEQYNELKNSYCYIADTFDIKDIVFCFPYGHIQTYNKDTINILKEIGYHSSFNTVRGTTCVRKTNKYELQRYDTVDLRLNKQQS
jgi:peptidoglycan/xylan/chitin deacetylase (PgdA/CDA1 family)